MKRMVLSATFAVVMFMGLALVLTWRSQDQQRLDDARRENCIAVEALKAIQRAAVQRQIRATHDFLRDHPSGIFGLPRDVLEEGIRRNERTLRELEPTEC